MCLYFADLYRTRKYINKTNINISLRSLDARTGNDSGHCRVAGTYAKHNPSTAHSSRLQISDVWPHALPLVLSQMDSCPYIHQLVSARLHHHIFLSIISSTGVRVFIFNWFCYFFLPHFCCLQIEIQR